MATGDRMKKGKSSGKGGEKRLGDRKRSGPGKKKKGKKL
jgi:hypothetical protein